MNPSYDPPNLPELVAQKTKMRMALREEYLKQVYNPHRHATGEGGVLFDPAHQRYLSMSNSRYLYFKPTIKTSFLGFATILLPFVGYILYIKNTREKKEHLLRTGQISYYDRDFKFY